TGAVIARRGDTGAILRSVTVSGGAGAVAVDERTGRAFVANLQNDSVSMLDGRTGAILATSLVARSPTAVVVDAPIGRVFVASSGVRVCTNLYPQKCSVAGSG